MEGQAQPPVATWASRRVLVTGADGFVGRWLVQALAASGAYVCALVRAGARPPRAQFSAPSRKTSEISAAQNASMSAPLNQRGETGREGASSNARGWACSPEKERLRVRQTGVDYAQGDITDLNFVSNLINDSAIDTVYHLAATNINTGANVSPYEVFETNIRGVYTVLEACRTAPKPARAIVSSSNEVEDCFLPGAKRRQHPYMTSKAAAELVSRAYGDTFGLPVLLVRPDNLYGGGDLNWNRLVPGTMRSLLRGERPVIRSNGLFQRDYVYVEDAVAAYLAIGARLDDPAVKGRLFRIASGTGTSVLDMVKQIIHVAGSDLEPHVLNEKSEARIDTFYTPELEQTVLGWKCQCSLEEGLSRTYRWYRDFFQDETKAGSVALPS